MKTKVNSRILMNSSYELHIFLKILGIQPNRRMTKLIFIFQDVYDFWRPKSSGVIGEPTYQYNRPGHPDEFQIGESNAEDFFDANFPDVSTELANQYQNMMRNANQHPMCMSSGMNVFMKDDEDSTPEGEPSPEGGANAWDPFGVSTLSDRPL